MKKVLLFILIAGIAGYTPTALAVPQLINYQGYMTAPEGTALDTTVAMTFRIYAMASGGNMLWMETHPSVVLANGLFHVTLGSIAPLTDLFDADRWLEIQVGSDLEMTPQQQIVSVAHAYRVGTVDGASGGTIGGDVNITDCLNVGIVNVTSGEWCSVTGGTDNTASGYTSHVGGGHHNSASGFVSVIGGGSLHEASGENSTIAGGQSNLAAGTGSTISGGGSNYASGGSSTIAGGAANMATHLFAAIGGGSGNHAFESYATVGGGTGNEVNSQYGTIGGGGNNKARGLYSVIAGGGGSTQADSNSAGGNYAVIGGGYHNYATGDASCIAGGYYHSAAGNSATIGGGYRNDASTFYATVGGGTYNSALGQYATVGGGRRDTSAANYSTVSGGYANYAGGLYSAIPGGRLNQAQGDYSLAAGYKAIANGDGSFCWADASGDTLTSFNDNEFKARAIGGFYFYTNTAHSTGARLPTGGSSWLTVSDSTKKQNIRLVDTKTVLDKVALLPIKQWSYKAQDPSIEHIGPMAQDFWNLFHLGDDSLSISTIDPSGIALAAIQELAKENSELKKELHELRAQVQTLLARDEQTQLSNKE